MFEFQTVLDVLNFAISQERMSQQFYYELSGRADDPGVQEFLLEMSHEEALHEEQLRSLVEEGAAALNSEISPEEIQSYIQSMDAPDEMDYKKAVKIAYNKENASQMLYSILGGMVESEPVQQLLQRLSKQEKKHKEFFSREYNRIQLSEN